MDDAELLGYVRERVADEAGLPEGWASRLHGLTLRELRDDARNLRRTLGLDPDTSRTADGRYASSHERMNAELRRAAGRG